VLGSSGPRGPPYIPFLNPNFPTPYLFKYPALPKESEPDLQISLEKGTSRTFSIIQEYSTYNKSSWKEINCTFSHLSNPLELSTLFLHLPQIPLPILLRVPEVPEVPEPLVPGD
jgi:hypothetical protein